MDGRSPFQKVSLDRTRNFSWVFLVDWVLTCIVTLTVIFYLGRIFGFLLTFILEWVVWKRCKVKINIESLRIAPLGGNIMFRNLCIIHRDYTISCLEGTINWRYWLFNSRKSQYQENLDNEEERLENGQEPKSNSGRKHPCRFLLACEGLEIFVYNKTSSYENIIHMFSKEERAQFEKFVDDQTMTELFNESEQENKVLSESTPSSVTMETVGSNDRNNNEDSNEEEDAGRNQNDGQAPNNLENDELFEQQCSNRKSMYMRFLPIQISTRRFSLVLGNRFTPSILVVSAKNSKGIIDLCPPKEKLDLFKIKLEKELYDVDASVKQNIGFDDDISTSFKWTRGRLSKLWQKFARIFLLPTLGPKHLQTQEDITFRENWKGLSLYRQNMEEDELENVDFDFANHEYARVISILKSAKIVFTYEYDIPGLVPKEPEETLQGPEVGNSGAPPEFGVDIQLYGANICYGPWAERQLSYLRALLSPVVSRTPKPIKTLTPGSQRIYTIFKTSISIMEESTWRIPTREKSKDQEFLRHYVETKEEFRPFGWIDLKFMKDSYGILDTVICPTEEGSPNNVNFHFSNMEIRTSVNHELLLRAKSFDFEADMGYPLGWNDQANWNINLSSTQLEIFILREHITLISDVFADFSSGDPTPYELFRPFIYRINWNLDGYSIYLNVNDHNIVNNPLDFNENCYLSLHGDHLIFDVKIPRQTVANRCTEITYHISTPMFRLLLNTPPWNTLNEFMKNKEVGRSYNFQVNGLYTVFSELDIDNVDTISVECSSFGTTLHCYGFVVRYLMNVKMNYFGDFSHFVTAEEYTNANHTEEPKNENLGDEHSGFNISSTEDVETDRTNPEGRPANKGIPMPKRSELKRTENEMDIWFVFSVWEGALILPETIYNSDPCIALHFNELEVDLRSTNYYMDLLATMNNTELKRYVSRHPHDLFECVRKDNGRQEKSHGYLSSLTIHGHRMYGLPPTEPTYFCQWGVDIDRLEINSDLEFAKGFLTCFSKIGFGFKNLENILLYETNTLFDMTSVTVRVKELKFMMNDADTSSRSVLHAKKITFTAIDFENEAYSQRVDFKFPDINFLIFELDENQKEGRFLLHLKTQLNFTDFIQNQAFADHRYRQREYITLHDSAYYRCSFLLPCFFQESVLYKELLGSISPSATLPPLPLPVLAETIDYIIEDCLGEYAPTVKPDDSSSSDTSEGQRTPLTNEDTRFQANSGFFSPHMPHNPPNNRDRYNNYVLDVEYVNLEVKPSVTGVLLNYLKKFYTEDTTDIIDKNEIAIVKKLGNLQYGASFVTTSRLHVKDLHFLYDFEEGSGVELALNSFDFDLRRKTIENEDEKVILEKTMFSNIHTLRISLLEAHPSSISMKPAALQLSIEDLELWSSTVDENVNSVNVTSFGFTLDESQLERISGYLFGQIKVLRDTITSAKELENLRKKTQKDLICDLTSASEYYQISHDPYVITKPAFIMRLSEGHVRENRSWRIITRLRHILTYLPNDWRTADHLVTVQDSENPNVPQRDEDIFVSVFSNWRNWDLSDITRSYIYKKIFLPQNEDSFKKELRTVLKINFQSFFFTVLISGYEVARSTIFTRTNIIVDVLPPSVNTSSENLFKQEKVITLTANMGAIKGEWGEEVFKLKELFSKFSENELDDLSNLGSISRSASISGFGSQMDRLESSRASGPGDRFRNLKIFATMIFERCDLHFVVGDTRLTNRIINGKNSMLLENSKENTPPALSAVFFAQRHEIWLKHSTNVLAEVLLKQLHVAATAQLGVIPFVSLNCQATNSFIRAMPSTVVLRNSVEKIKRQVEVLIPQFKSHEVKNSSAVTKKTPRIPIKFDIRFNFTDMSSEIMLLSPFYLLQDVKQLHIYASGHENMELVLGFLEYDVYLKSQLSSEQFFKFSSTDLQFKCEVADEVVPVVEVQISTSLMKLTLCEPRRALHNLLQDEQTLVESVDHIQKLWNFLRSASGGNDRSPSRNTRWALDANLKYFGLLVPVSSICYIFELHSLFASLTNANEQYEEYDRHFSGQIVVESCYLLVKELSLPANLSKVLDFSIRFLTSQKVPNSLQSYQIESSYFRLCLFPELLVDILWSVHYLQSLLNHFKKHHTPWLPYSSNKTAKSGESTLDFRSIHILSYNFCVGWLFEVGDNSEPGLILGYDRLFSAYEKHFGKLTLIDGYLSVANGNTSDTFYSQKSEKDSYTRTYLSNMQIFYWLKGENLLKDLFVRFHGEVIDVRFLSTSFKLVEKTLHSIKRFNEMKKAKIKQTGSSTKSKLNMEAASNTLAPFLAHIRTINSQLNFAGGVFKVYSPTELDSKAEPLLEIKSPGVQMAINYEFNETREKSHCIRFFTTIEPTHNMLFAKCAPLLSDFNHNIKNMIRNLSSEDKSHPSKPVTDSIDYKSLLNPYDIAFEIASGKQKLSFSCEPKAKVQLDAGFNSFLFRVTTDKVDSVEPFNVSFSMDKIESSVRHIFSRDSSAAFMLDYIDIVMMFTYPNVYGVALVSDMNIYCNMKQRQNLNIFLDIWRLSNRGRTKPSENKAEDKSDAKKSLSPPFSPSSNDSRKVFPWSFTIIFTNMGGVVDLGPSLGVLTLGLEQVWITTKHQGDQKRTWHTFAHGITVNSEGRLSGMFELDQASSVSEISWPEEDLLRVGPLISVSMAINRMSIKSAFDYHMFLIGSMKSVKVHLHNESDTYAILPDLLQVSLEFESIVLCATALTAANALDIYNTIMRMQQDNRISYIETLKESNISASSTSVAYEEVLNSLNLLRTDMSVIVKELKVHISPMSLFDAEVLVVSVRDVNARSETQSGEKLKTELQLQISDVNASLSSSKEELDEETVSKIAVDDYMLYASKFSGGTIIKLPQLLVSMTTWQQQSSPVLEYLFTCKFFDKISMKWNLGPVNFIKEMWATHVRSLAVRRTQLGNSSPELEVANESDKEDTVKSKFIYVPLDEPYIEMPQIKDLGDATPPLEWFGVHRKNLPAATHQTAVLLIQKLVHTAEKEYAKLQQRA
ncbi:hypothetical protein ZYGR_0I00690 [Zygosaccharomyces rouxii]|uniref:ZYRO0C01694p n=2 Tax=Zygosaccharomyces rouxii TaxID=4956 RepID=C5DSN6_ZYGRC|nr:uncharacterized protein ZYRO0C01694g [Zygosaccharomyces rouxii]KAH9202013.1 hypothetical protein LQ764DRAFT_92294 [Zygosaccharomyces rouxii]GAV47773.1 hypothetical protein ZYGR_0I00690 [Zygosaccharomyces rouxii]CAR26797.1 ZYRO0C01694p [Zygosaccharomyces rouxii]